MANRKLYEALANRVQARANCERMHALGNSTGNHEWHAKHTDAAESLVREYMPSGSGFDSGTRIDWDKSTAEKLVFTTSFHHMNDGGMYDGWTEHSVTVRASLLHGISLQISGRNRNDIKDYMHDVFSSALETVGEF